MAFLDSPILRFFEGKKMMMAEKQFRRNKKGRNFDNFFILFYFDS